MLTPCVWRPPSGGLLGPAEAGHHIQLDRAMDDLLITRFAADLVGRLHGPMTLRFVLQPVMAIVAATRDGLKDAREDRPPYFWTIFTRPEERRALLREGWKAMARTIAIGSGLDAVSHGI